MMYGVCIYVVCDLYIQCIDKCCNKYSSSLTVVYTEYRHCIYSVLILYCVCIDNVLQL